MQWNNVAVKVCRVDLFSLAVFTPDKLKWTDLHQADPVRRRFIGHACQRHEADWLQGCRTAVRELSIEYLLNNM